MALIVSTDGAGLQSVSSPTAPGHATSGKLITGQNQCQYRSVRLAMESESERGGSFRNRIGLPIRIVAPDFC
jgi:hypothetical protein